MGAPSGTSGPSGTVVGAIDRRRTILVAAALLAAVVVVGVLVWPGGDDAAAPVPAVPTPPTASVAPTPQPGTLAVSASSMDLGRTTSHATFEVTNTGDLPIAYQLSSRTPWLRADTIGGELAGGGSTRVTLFADRSAVREGPSTARLLVTWDGGTAPVKVTLDAERPPVVRVRAAPAGSSCDVDLEASVTDDTAVASATLLWTGPTRSGTKAMAHVSGAVWTARVHAGDGGTFTFQVTATDVRGNAGTGPTVTAVVEPCRN